MIHLRRGLCSALAPVLFFFATTASAQTTVTFAWDPSADATGYTVRWGTSLGVYPNAADAGPAISAAVPGFTEGKTYFAVVEAYNSAGDRSDPSAPFQFVAPPPVIIVPETCTFELTAASVNVAADSTAGSVGMTTGLGCPWKPVSQSPFITLSVPVGLEVKGAGTISFNVAENFSTKPRTGTITAGGETFTINQSGAAVDLTLQARERARADLNGDGFNDLLWQDTASGYLAGWMLKGSQATWTAVSFPQLVKDSDWRIVGTGDFNADGKPDIVWHNRRWGTLYVWYMNNGVRIGAAFFSIEGEKDTRWKVVGVGDFNGDHKPDLVWQHDTGWLAIWLMDGMRVTAWPDVTPNRVKDLNWRVVGVADLNGDDKSDLIFEHLGTGDLTAWMMNGTVRTQFVPFVPGAVLDKSWRFAGVTDVDGDQTPDFIWQHERYGAVAVWYMNGTLRTNVATFSRMVGTNWLIVGAK